MMEWGFLFLELHPMHNAQTIGGWSMANIFARIRRPSLREGLMWGLILGVVEIVYGFAISYVTQASVQALLSNVILALFLVFGFIAAQRASRETGKLGSGVMAGIWTGLVGSILYGLVPLVNTFINLSNIVATTQLYIRAHPNQFPGMKPTDYTASDALTTMGLYLLFYVVILYTLLALVGGAVGGFMGRRRALVSQPSEEYEETMFEPSVKLKSGGGETTE
jgi:signal transduction histidine kinase